VQRTIMVGGLLFHVGGISGVATLPEFRGRGLASQAVRAAMQFIKDELKLEYCLLTTGLHRKTFYENLGWQTISEPTYFDQPSGRMKNGGLTMVLSLSGKPWPPGEINLCGLPW
jgi:GNAT superfamily N-acetyltransferase